MIRIFLMLVVGLVVAGCGPVQSTVEISQATVDIQAAHRLQAQKKAPYYFYKAKAYLLKAKDERAYSDFDEAKVLAQKAIELAQKAKEIASQDTASLLEENELKLEKSATDNVDASKDVEIMNVADQDELKKKNLQEDDDNLD